MTSLYSILQCCDGASYEELKTKYQWLVMKHHPDKSNNSTNSEEFIRINTAWNVLRDPEKKKMYDSELAQEQLSQNPPLYDTVKKCELEKIDDGSYIYMCRCGGTYSVTADELKAEECIIACSECSFFLCVKNGAVSSK